jgi:hypothetical protein
MKGLLDNQTSGNDWSKDRQDPPMLHEGSQEIERFPASPIEQGKFFAKYEDDYERFDQAQKAAMAEIKAFYSIRRDAEIDEFLRSHKDVTQLLAEAIPHLRKHFAGCMFSLRTTFDENDDQTIYAVASWTQEPRKVIDALNDFFDEWWLPNSYPAGRCLTFTYDLA